MVTALASTNATVQLATLCHWDLWEQIVVPHGGMLTITVLSIPSFHRLLALLCTFFSPALVNGGPESVAPELLTSLGMSVMNITQPVLHYVMSCKTESESELLRKFLYGSVLGPVL